MPWTETARREHARRRPRYASDVNDQEWALIAPLLPPDRRQGRPRKTDLREVVNAILYMATTGCQWRMLPSDLPPPSTVQRYFYAWRDQGLWQGISNTLVMAARDLKAARPAPRRASSTASPRKPRRAEGLAASTPASGSRAASATRRRPALLHHLA